MLDGQKLFGERTTAQLAQVGQLAQKPLSLVFEVGVIGGDLFHIVVCILQLTREKQARNTKTHFYLVHPAQLRTLLFGAEIPIIEAITQSAATGVTKDSRTAAVTWVCREHRRACFRIGLRGSPPRSARVVTPGIRRIAQARGRSASRRNRNPNAPTYRLGSRSLAAPRGLRR